MGGYAQWHRPVRWVRFTVFDKRNTPGITANRFAGMVPGIGGDLWLYTENGGITRYHRNLFHVIGESEGVPSGSVHGLTDDRHGNIWIVRDEKIFEWNEGADRFEAIANDDEVQYNPRFSVPTLSHYRIPH